MKAMPIVAVCGKGGVGKTVFSALLARVLMESGIAPLLLIDADPVGGLTSAIGEKVADTLAGVRDRFIKTARKGGRAKLAQAASQLDYCVLQALVERKDYALLAMGHNEEKGCFCPANDLLRSAINTLVPSFAGVLIDAEAGIEQINRNVTHRVGQIIVVVDASQRSLETLRMIAEMVKSAPVAVVANRVSSRAAIPIPKGAQWLGSIPENDALRQFDRAGRPLWQLPPENEAVTAVQKIARALGWKTHAASAGNFGNKRPKR